MSFPAYSFPLSQYPTLQHSPRHLLRSQNVSEIFLQVSKCPQDISSGLKMSPKHFLRSQNVSKTFPQVLKISPSYDSFLHHIILRTSQILFLLMPPIVTIYSTCSYIISCQTVFTIFLRCEFHLYKVISWQILHCCWRVKC